MSSVLPIETLAFVAGAWVESASGARFVVRNPASGDVVAEAADCGVADAAAAISGAMTAMPGWAGQSAATRGAILRRWRDLILAHQAGLAALITAEMGKPLAEAQGEIAYGAAYVDWFAEEGKRAYGDVIPSPFASARIVTVRQPLGLVAAITPWNFPAAMLLRKVAPALAAGCAIIVKPAEDSPLTALALARLAQAAGVPAAILSVLPASQPAAVGDALLSAPEVRKLSFTGSTQTGKRLLAAAAGTVKRVSMELGGNAPFLVFDDCDLDAAVAAAIKSKYRNAGQTCVCANRFLVQAGVHDRFVAKFAAAAADLRVGPGADPGTDVGPLVNAAALHKVEALVAEAISDGAAVAAGGGRHGLGGLFFEPTVLVGVLRQARILDSEIFGPVAPVVRFTTEEEAISLANATPYGLAAYLFTRDHGRAWRVGEALEVGMVAINEGILSSEVAPFGGVKLSGFGREGGRQGLEDYMETKYMLMGGIAPKGTA
jgi:succinate-semialdehyde dehydrogenase/glutarate-semialdehyde dehydrogenase